MKRGFILIAAAVICGSLVGCASRYADVPTPTRFAKEDQQKLQAARHWQLIADHFAGQLAAGLRGKLGGRAIYVPRPGNEQLFVEGFRELLTTSLVNKGVPVADNAPGALVADVRYNVYRFRPERIANMYYTNETTPVEGLQGFVWVNNEETWEKSASGPVPRSEILLTVSVSDGGGIIHRQSSVYYVADEDAGLYWARSGGATTLKVVGDCWEGEAKCVR